MAKSPRKKKKPKIVELNPQVIKNEQVVEMLIRCKIPEVHYRNNMAFCKFYWSEFDDYRQEVFMWALKKVKNMKIKKQKIKDGDPDQPLKGFLHLVTKQLIAQARVWANQHNKITLSKTVNELVKTKDREYSIYNQTPAPEDDFLEQLERDSFLDVLMEELVKMSQKRVPLHHILALRMRGAKLEEIGKQYGITKEGVRMYEKQIIAIAKTLKK